MSEADCRLDPELFLRPDQLADQLIKTWTQKYLNDEVDVWEFERGVWVALVHGSLSEDLDARGAPMRVPAYLRS